MLVVGGCMCDDETLGCFVKTVTKGGPADLNRIEVGDQILEFNGHSLIDSTFEEYRTLQNSSGQYVQLIVQHNGKHDTSSKSFMLRNYQTIPLFSNCNCRRRRNLPALPIISPVNEIIMKPKLVSINFTIIKININHYKILS
jgi:hypothetical protein